MINTKLHVRPATTNDLYRIYEIYQSFPAWRNEEWASWDRERYEAFLADPINLTIVAQLGENVIGTASITYTKPPNYPNAPEYTSADFHGRVVAKDLERCKDIHGVAESMLLYIFDDASRRGFQKCGFRIADKGPEHIYRKFGFCESEPPEYKKNDHDERLTKLMVMDMRDYPANRKRILEAKA